jgi:hypothetical protein
MIDRMVQSGLKAEKSIHLQHFHRFFAELQMAFFVITQRIMKTDLQLVFRYPLQMFVADDVQYNSVAATSLSRKHRRCFRDGRGMLQYHLVYPPSFWQARRRRAVSARPYGATEVHCDNLIYKYKTNAE